MWLLGGLFATRLHISTPVEAFLSLTRAVLGFAPEICNTAFATDTGTFKTPRSAAAFDLAIREIFRHTLFCQYVLYLHVIRLWSQPDPESTGSCILTYTP